MELLLPANADVWITALTKDYAGLLLEKLISKGYTVSALHPDKRLSLTRENSVSSVMALTLSKNINYLKSSDVLIDLEQCLGDINAYYYSIVVFSMGRVSWAVGNTVIEAKNNPPGPKKKDRSHLRVVKNEITSDNNT